MRRNIATNFGRPFSAAPKALVLGNLFKLFRLEITFAREVRLLGIKMKKIIFPMANSPVRMRWKI